MFDNYSSLRNWVLFSLGLAFVLLVQGAIPFIMAPTLGQAIWTTGFAQSFANDSIFSIYAKNFGIPEPAPIAFGLSGAWPTSFFIKLGLRPIDAYTSMIAMWLSVSFCFAFKFGRYFSLSHRMATLGAVAWGTMPIIWAHAGYSMLSTGIALLPFYVFSGVYFIDAFDEDWGRDRFRILRGGSLYLIACVISVFMDGYTFLMFSVASVFLFSLKLILGGRKGLVKCSFLSFVCFIIIFIAYALYKQYIGGGEFNVEYPEWFRAWGVDVSFLIIPTKGMHWVMDLLGLSIVRSQKSFFGDASTWVTSFCVPIFVGGVWAMCRSNADRYVKLGIVLCFVFGFYMSLGPSLKINSQKPEGWGSSLMLAEHAIGSTGSDFLMKWPGFEHMRASYRWLALGILGAWLLTITTLADPKRGFRIFGASLLFLVIVFNLPEIPGKMRSGMKYRTSFLAIENEIVAEMRDDLPRGATVAFLPWHNDFLINYIASKIDIRTYNIGGDKNLEMARESWPEVLRQFPRKRFDANFSERVIRLLAQKDADFVVIPYVDLLGSAHKWPAPFEFKNEALSVAEEMEVYGAVEIFKRNYYLSVSLLPHWREQDKEEIFDKLSLSISGSRIQKKGFSRLPRTRVGEIKDEWLVTTGRKGFLHFGPYMPLDRGTYHLTLYGTAESVSTAWVDIASSSGKVIHKKFSLSEMPRLEDNVLISEEIVLDRTVGDLEIRIFVDEGDKLSIWGYLIK